MNKETYRLLEGYMLSCMAGSTQDAGHVYRVLYAALDIARTEEDVDHDVLISACLLHDVGREKDSGSLAVSHASAGAEKAHGFLLGQGFSEHFAGRVRDCVRTHGLDGDGPPASLEAKILFDADKLDTTGAVGIARTLFSSGPEVEPLYSLLPNGRVSDGSGDPSPSFFQEYKEHLENAYGGFQTTRGRALAQQRQAAAASFYNSMLREVQEAYNGGERNLGEYVN